MQSAQHRDGHRAQNSILLTTTDIIIIPFNRKLSPQSLCGHARASESALSLVTHSVVVFSTASFTHTQRIKSLFLLWMRVKFQFLSGEFMCGFRGDNRPVSMCVLILYTHVAPFTAHIITASVSAENVYFLAPCICILWVHNFK